MISFILIALDNPLKNPNSDFRKLLIQLDIAITSIYGFEIILKFIVILINKK